MLRTVRRDRTCRPLVYSSDIIQQLTPHRDTTAVVLIHNCMDLHLKIEISPPFLYSAVYKTFCVQASLLLCMVAETASLCDNSKAIMCEKSKIK